MNEKQETIKNCTPLHLNLMLHYFACADQYSPQSCVASRYTEDLVRLGLVAKDETSGSGYRATERGEKFIKSLEQTRLPDYQKPEKKRWFVNVTDTERNGEVIGLAKAFDPEVSGWSIYEYEESDEHIEVQEFDLPYLEKPEGDWEFRKPEKGDVYLTVTFNEEFTCTVSTPPLNALSGYRWCKPRKADGRWVEYPIIKEEHYYSCHIMHICETPIAHVVNIHELPSIVGFGGVQFENTQNAWWWHLGQHEASGKPATPIRARFWVEN